MEIKVGNIYKAKNQGNTITPQIINIAVVWISDRDVYYRLADSKKVKETPIERFIKIVQCN